MDMGKTNRIILLLVTIAGLEIVVGERNEVWYSDNVLTAWTRMEDKLKLTVNKLIDNSYFVDKNALNISFECRSSIDLFVQELRQLKTWTLMMLDASAKLPSGLLEGNFADLGSYDECINILHVQENGNPIRGQYCSLDIYPPLPSKPRFYQIHKHIKELEDFTKKDTAVSHLSKISQFFYSEPLRWSVCLPSQCSLEDVQALANTITPYTELKPKVVNCEMKTDVMITRDQIFAMWTIGILVAITIIGTSLDVYLLKEGNEVKLLGSWYDTRANSIAIMRCFSVVSNTKKILDTSGSQGIPVLHGIRVLTMMWIILGHTYLYISFNLYGNLGYFRESMKELWFQIISNATVAVDTFYFLSGLLTSFIVVKQNVKFSIPLFLFHRFWRLTPVYMIVICFTLLLPHFGSGPVWKESVISLTEDCRDNWWTNLLYVNNILVPSRQCLPHSWFLPVEMQFHFLSLLFFLPLVKGKILLGKLMPLLITVTGAAITGVTTYIKRYPPTELHENPDGQARMEMKSDIYFMIYPHTGAYCIGLLLGYTLCKEKPVHFTKKTTIIGWLLSATCSLLVVFGVYNWNQGNLPIPLVSSLYASLHRTAWALAVAWVVLACETGYGGIINRCLSWKMLIPLSRLTYLAFLLHPLVLWTHVGITRERFHFNHYYMFHKYIAHVILSYSLAFVFSVLFEAPFCSIEKIMFRGRIEKTFVPEVTKKSNGKSKQLNVNGHTRNFGD